MSELSSLPKQGSEMARFLSAEVGIGASGERLTVNLALTHLGADPMVEAGHLATLSRISASAQLARSIVSTPGSMWNDAAATAISRRLVRLLPVHGPIGGA